MAEDAPVAPTPESTEKTEQPPAEESADKAPETSSNTEDKPTESANVSDEKKDTEPEADKTGTSDEVAESKGDGEDAAAADAEPTAEPNGTPASSKKSSKDRRRSSGVGEKKLSRKKSMTRVTQLNAKPGDYFLARLRSYSPWPAIICDEEILPVSLIESRPVTAAQEDGSFRADYADDGKRAHERTYPVMFFQTNEFAWVINTNLTPLDPAECKNISEKNKTKQLIAAYGVAAEGHDLDHFKKLLAEHQNAIEAEILEEEKKEAEKAEKAKAKADKAAEKAAEKKKKTTKRKSKAAETDVEMEDAEEPKKPKASAKKRKNEADDETEKPAKTPKTATKIKLTTPKASAEETGKKAPASKAKKATTKKGKAAAAAAAASDDEDQTSSKEPEKQANPEELKKKKEKEVLFLRHKLQKGFISRDQPPKEDEMATMATYFDKLEKHSDLEVSIIRSTKINKVLKMIVKLNSIPRDEEFKFRERAIKTLSNWKNVLDSDAPADGAKPTPNGTSKDEDAADTPKLETEEEKEPETKNTNEDTPMPDAKADSKEETDEKSASNENADAEPEEKPTEEKVEASA